MGIEEPEVSTESTIYRAIIIHTGIRTNSHTPGDGGQLKIPWRTSLASDPSGNRMLNFVFFSSVVADLRAALPFMNFASTTPPGEKMI